MSTLKLGSKGNEVTRIQKRLNELGYKDNSDAFLSEDGSFGQKTEQAVNKFKDAIIPGGNDSEWRGQVGQTTWNALNNAKPFNPWMVWIPPFEYNDSGKPWNDKDIADFKLFDVDRVTVSWDGCNFKLIEAYGKFEKECQRNDFIVRVTSAFRPLIYQAHFYELVKGSASKTEMGRTHNNNIHGVRSASYPRRTSSTHILGIAFDAIVMEGSIQLNPPGRPIDPRIVSIANSVGLKTPPVNDTVHFELAVR